MQKFSANKLKLTSLELTMEFQVGVDSNPFTLALPQVDTAVNLKAGIISQNSPFF